MKRRLFAVLLCVCFVCALLPIFSICAFANVTYVVIPNVGSVGANTSNTVSNYSPYWQYWSQGASKYQKMRDAGCRVVAQSKMLVELGAASGDSIVFNPDIYLEWAMPRGYWPSAPDNILEQHAVGTAAIAYAQENGIVLKREGYIPLSGTNNANDVALVMQYINAGYYVIMHCSAHQAYIGRIASLSAGTPIILDSWYTHSYSQAACCRYSGYTSAYFSGFYYFSTSTPPAPTTMDWTEELCNPTETSAYISIKAVPSVSGTFGECGITLKDADTGAVVGSKTETADPTARTYLTIYYYVTEELGVVLTPGKTYTYQFYTYFNGTRYDSPIGSFTTPHAHSYMTAITAPTCTQQGYTTHTCSICGDSYVDTYVSALDHDFGAWIQTLVPTCTEKGEEKRTCSRCETYETREVNELGHNLIHYAAQAPTCTENGWNAYQTCSRCDYSTYAEIAALGHDLVVDAAVSATCTEAGLAEGSHCSRCDYKVTQETVPALGHDWDDGVITTKPTETEKGEKTFTCTRCGETRTEVIPATGSELKNPFVDVKESDYFYDAVLWAYYAKPQVTNGLDATHFGPAATCTRGQIVTFLWRALGEPAPTITSNPFVDVKESDYYYKAVLWAYEKGVTTGTDASHFAPGDFCKREHAVAFLYRAAGKPEYANKTNPFSDVSSSTYYYDAVLWAVEKNITNGIDAKHFGPANACQRSQIVAFLYRFMNP